MHLDHRGTRARRHHDIVERLELLDELAFDAIPPAPFAPPIPPAAVVLPPVPVRLPPSPPAPVVTLPPLVVAVVVLSPEHPAATIAANSTALVEKIVVVFMVIPHVIRFAWVFRDLL